MTKTRIRTIIINIRIIRTRRNIQIHIRRITIIRRRKIRNRKHNNTKKNMYNNKNDKHKNISTHKEGKEEEHTIRRNRRNILIIRRKIRRK